MEQLDICRRSKTCTHRSASVVLPTPTHDKPSPRPPVMRTRGDTLEFGNLDDGRYTGNNTCKETPGDVTRAAAQAHPINLPTYLSTSSTPQNLPRHADCISLTHSYPTYGMTAEQLHELNVVLPVNNRVEVRNLNIQLDEENICYVFSVCGRVISVPLIRDKKGNPRGNALVTYTHPIESLQAIRMMREATLYDRRIFLSQDLAGPMPIIHGSAATRAGKHCRRNG